MNDGRWAIDILKRETETAMRDVCVVHRGSD